MQGNPKGKIAAQGKAGDEPVLGRDTLLHIAQRINDLLQPAGMKYSRVQVVAVAVVAKIEAKNIVSVRKQARSQGQHVVGP